MQKKWELPPKETETGTATEEVPVVQVPYVFAVITRIPDPAKGEGGNMACSLSVARSGTKGGVLAVELLPPVLQLGLRTPVFALGEVVILDGENGREVCGAQRKPSKWDVDVEHFASVRDAVLRSRVVTN